MTALILFAFVIVGITLLGIGFSVLRTLFKNLGPNDARIQSDIRQMRTEIEPYINELVPLNQEELKLFSLNQINQTLKKSITTIGKGIFTSIYQEPLLAYAYKKYVGKHDALIFARTAEYEIVYRIKKKDIKVVVNKVFLGTIRNGKLYGDSKRHPVAQLQEGNRELLLPVLVGDTEIAALNTDENDLSPNPRAFRYINHNLTGEEEKAFLSLTILKLVQRATNH